MMEASDRKTINLNFGRMSDKTVSAMAAQTLSPDVALESASPPSSADAPDKESLSSPFNQAASAQTDNETLRSRIRRIADELKDAYAI